MDLSLCRVRAIKGLDLLLYENSTTFIFKKKNEHLISIEKITIFF